MATLLDWKAWRLVRSAGSVATQLWFAAVRRASTSYLDSQLWILKHNLTWIGQADVGIQHLAAQLVAALKPFAGTDTKVSVVVIFYRRSVIFIYSFRRRRQRKAAAINTCGSCTNRLWRNATLIPAQF